MSINKLHRLPMPMWTNALPQKNASDSPCAQSANHWAGRRKPWHSNQACIARISARWSAERRTLRCVMRFALRVRCKVRCRICCWWRGFDWRDFAILIRPRLPYTCPPLLSKVGYNGVASVVPTSVSRSSASPLANCLRADPAGPIRFSLCSGDRHS